MSTRRCIRLLAQVEPRPPWIILARVCFHNWRVNIESIQAPSVLLSSDRWAFANRLARTGMSNRCVLVFLSLLTALELAVAVILLAFRMKEMQLPRCHSVPDPNLIRGDLVLMSPAMSGVCCRAAVCHALPSAEFQSVSTVRASAPFEPLYRRNGCFLRAKRTCLA